MRVQNTFTITLGLTLLISFVIVAVVFYRNALDQAEAEAMREARMMLEVATAARAHTAEQVTPLLNQLPADAFHPESVPAHAAQNVIKRFNARFPEYTYREKALNPTNLDDLPSSWEVDLIQRFRSNPALPEIAGVRQENGRELLYIAQPIQISDPACLSCHSKPENAPPAMVAAYGSANGFGWKQDEIVGAKIVTVPKADRLASALSNVFWFLIALGSVLVVALLVAAVVVRRAVADPVHNLAERAERLSKGEGGAEELPEVGPAEFRKLSKAINRLHRSLRLMLKEAEAR